MRDVISEKIQCRDIESSEYFFNFIRPIEI